MYPKKFWNEFRLPKWPDEIFIGMCFDDDNVSKRYYPIIEKAIEKTTLKPRFLKNIITGDSIPIDIMTGIIECSLVLFDISLAEEVKGKNNRNANVMYELGLAHAWRNPEEVIVIRDDDLKLPFDIQSNGVVQYNISDKENAINIIRETILFRLDQIEKIQRSMVRKAAESLSLQASNFLIATSGNIRHDADLKEIDKLLAIPLLLNLGLVSLLRDKGGYGYYPTQLGKRVIQYYGFTLAEDNIKEYETLYKPDY